eukprot:CAMPEP_0174312720 /NCGR_PEP_ID=MMETSP0810-20121108/4473_1 /TAXON_ID=73025 ORGANISM="Eutreptiella gymnastica-like, Strain CCMP1594" /NCGR_SAMPLE_ID=MMETSP0810 /ASSEMBLY_ACC=CAM_ASM_000659 /LENGTH=180 /DNA_ID=CAMNT_0015421197 /DNA_START=150 /DNA_END=692 /DNA_ORIENTATION=+
MPVISNPDIIPPTPPHTQTPHSVLPRARNTCVPDVPCTALTLVGFPRDVLNRNRPNSLAMDRGPDRAPGAKSPALFLALACGVSSGWWCRGWPRDRRPDKGGCAEAVWQDPLGPPAAMAGPEAPCGAPFLWGCQGPCRRAASPVGHATPAARFSFPLLPLPNRQPSVVWQRGLPLHSPPA